MSHVFLRSEIIFTKFELGPILSLCVLSFCHNCVIFPACLKLDSLLLSYIIVLLLFYNNDAYVTF